MLRSTIHLPPIEEGEFLLCYVKCCRGIRKVLESLFFLLSNCREMPYFAMFYQHFMAS